MIAALDLTDIDAHESLTQTIIDTYGKIDVLILNAGISQRNLAVDAPLLDTKYIMDLNFFSVISLTKTVLPRMVSSTQGGQVRY